MRILQFHHLLRYIVGCWGSFAQVDTLPLPQSPHFHVMAKLQISRAAICGAKWVWRCHPWLTLVRCWINFACTVPHPCHNRPFFLASSGNHQNSSASAQANLAYHPIFMFSIVFKIRTHGKLNLARYWWPWPPSCGGPFLESLARQVATASLLMSQIWAKWATFKPWHSMKLWLVSRDLYNGVLKPKKKLGSVIPYIYIYSK